MLRLARIAVAIACLSCAAIWAQRVARIGAPPAEAGDALRHAVEVKGYRVALDAGWTAQFWFASALATAKHDAPDALYPELINGEFVAVLKLAQGMTDFRGQKIPAGLYALRYQRLPQDGNHLGVAPNPDFLLAVPAAADSHPEQTYEYKKLVALSARSTGGNHPAVIALDNAGQAGAAAKTDSGAVFTVAIPAGAKTEVIGICLTCSASQ